MQQDYTKFSLQYLDMDEFFAENGIPISEHIKGQQGLGSMKSEKGNFQLFFFNFKTTDFKKHGKTDDPCHSRCSTPKNPHCLMAAMNAEFWSKFEALHG